MSSRLKNGFRSIMAAFINRIILMILPFVFRTVVLYTVGVEYLGLGTLFTSVITVLSLSELGFGTALVYSMYEPVANGDREKISALLNMYRKIYSVIGIFIWIIGTCITPFIKYIIKNDVPAEVNIYILYYLTLMNVVASYLFFAYKKALLMAYQRNDVISNVGTISGIFMYGVQIILLMVTHNYYFVVIMILFTTIIGNLYTAIFANRLYPDIKCGGRLSKTELGAIWKNVKGIALQKICSVSRNSLDSIVISINLGLVDVAKYGNYFTVLNSLHVVLYQIPSSILPSVGNSVVSESVQKNHRDYRKFNFIYMWISGVFICCSLCVCQPFMELWMGRDNMFPILTLVLFCIYFYELSSVDILYLYKDAAGLWWFGRYATVLEAVLNLLLNFLLGSIWGVNGVLIATIITVFFITMIFYGYIIFKHYFGVDKFMSCIRDNAAYMIACFIATVCAYLLCTRFQASALMEIILYGIISFSISNIVFWIILRKHRCYQESKELIKSIINNFRKDK